MEFLNFGEMFRGAERATYNGKLLSILSTTYYSGTPKIYITYFSQKLAELNCSTIAFGCGDYNINLLYSHADLNNYKLQYF